MVFRLSLCFISNANVLVHNAAIITMYQYPHPGSVCGRMEVGEGEGEGGRVWIFVASSGIVIDKLFLL